MARKVQDLNFDCSTQHRNQHKYDDQYIKYYEICRPVVQNMTSTTDLNGRVRFPSYKITRGPTGKYTFILKHGDIKSEKFVSNVVSEVEEVVKMN